MEELNSRPPNTNPSSDSEEDLNLGSPNYKFSALTTRPRSILHFTLIYKGYQTKQSFPNPPRRLILICFLIYSLLMLISQVFHFPPRNITVSLEANSFGQAFFFNSKLFYILNLRTQPFFFIQILTFPLLRNTIPVVSISNLGCVRLVWNVLEPTSIPRRVGGGMW